jgi:hypothetical protein
MMGALAIAAAAGAATSGSARPSYAKRLTILENLAARYPGRVEPGNPIGRYGLWGGIVVQTTWQKDSGRDRIVLWSAMNRHLSVEPSSYARLLERADPDPKAQALCSSTARPDVCAAWLRYLIGARKGLPAPTLLTLLWRAHTTAIASALRSQRRLFASARTTSLERNFWASWVEIVFLLEAAHFPTDAATSVRASRLLMPRCSPLGAPGCRLRPADLGPAFPFVSTLAVRQWSVDRALAELRTLRTNPGALTALQLSDPPLGVALNLYLAVAR